MLEIKPIVSALLRSKVGAILLLLQIAITVAIVSNAAFIIHDRTQYLQQETGYPEDQIFSFAVNTFGEPDDVVQLMLQTQETVRNIPGVISASMISEVPLSGSGSASGFSIIPVSERDNESYRSIRSAHTGGDASIVESLGLTITEGRNFLPSEVLLTDDPAAIPSVVIVSRTFLNELYPDGDGLGKQMYVGNDAVTIVGVVEKMMGPWLKDSAPDHVSIFPHIEIGSYQSFVVRTAAEQRAEVMAQIENVLLEQYEERVIMSLDGMDDNKEEYNAADLLMLRMLVVIITVLVLITALGIFGMTVFNISKRTKQIGTRRALGARKSAIVRYFLVENGLVCALGLIFGSIGAVYISNVMMQEFSVPALNYWYVGITAVSVFALSLLSVLVPANRAANISPSIATRSI
ncbi:ABC transporter permease [Alteromonas facilis]|uniref:ABC transporter permease n=1 Tax=Alteromonas facilis TaxID=2048004 RepID=UPI000C2930E7|nr:FtsX-like permease family protein [Alteromonas facilis]